MKTIERFIICVVFLLLSYAVCGCKEKAEAYEPSYQAIYNRALSAEELDEIYKDEPALGRLAKDLWGVGEGRIKIVEPNEPEEQYLHIWEPKEPEYAWKCSCGERFPEMLSIQCLCGKEYNTLEILIKNIPTWPDYIKLDKTLHLYWENPNSDPNNPWNTDSEWTIGKGTKIYFKDKQ